MAPLRTLICRIALAGACCTAHAQCSKPIVIVTEKWPAKNVSAQAQEGIDLEMARAVIKEAGCTLIQGAELPVIRRIRMFAEGKFDMMLAASNIPERHTFARFTTSYRIETVGLFVLERNYEDLGDINSFEAIAARKLKLLVPHIGWYGPEYERRRGLLDAEGRLSRFGTNSQGLMMLQAKRGELMMGDTLAVAAQARQLGIPIRQIGFVVMRAPVHLMLSKATTTERDIHQLNGAIARLEKNGTLRAIGQRYGLN
jgi:polar amino acid transport system substrate-binding protein